MSAIIYETTFSITSLVFSPFHFFLNAADSALSIMFSIVLSFICGTFQMIFSYFNFILSVIVNTFYGVLAEISRLKYYFPFLEYRFEVLLVLDAKRTVLLLLLVLMLWQVKKMKQRRLASKTAAQRKIKESNSAYLDFSGTPWKSGSFEGKQSNFSRVSPWESGDFNRILDFALRELCHRCRGNISVGPIYKSDKVPILQTDWLLKADDCVLKHLDTAHRVGCATTREEPGGDLVLDATIGLRKLRVNVINYYAHAVIVVPICVSGEFVGTVESLSVRVEVAFKSPFAVDLRSFRITSMGPPQVSITGLGIWTLLGNMLQSSILSRESLENYLTPIFEEVLEDLTSRISDIPTTRQMKIKSKAI